MEFNNQISWRNFLKQQLNFEVLSINIPGVFDNNFNYDWDFLKSYLSNKIDETGFDNLYFIGFSSSFPILHLLAQQVYKSKVKCVIGLNPAWIRPTKNDGIASRVGKDENGSGLIFKSSLERRLQSDLLEDKTVVFDFIKKCYNIEKLEYWRMPTTVYSSIFKELKTYKNNYLRLNYVLMTSLLDEDVDQDISKKIIEDLNCKHNITFSSVPHFFIWSKNRFKVFKEVNKFLLIFS